MKLEDTLDTELEKECFELARCIECPRHKNVEGMTDIYRQMTEDIIHRHNKSLSYVKSLVLDYQVKILSEVNDKHRDYANSNISN